MKTEKMKIEELSDDKLEHYRASRPRADEKLTVIVKVHVPNYVPGGFDVRARVDEYMFTAECSNAELTAAQADPNVESIAPARKLRAIR